MNHSVIPLHDLVQRINQREAELQELHREYASRQGQLGKLTQQKEQLQAQLQQVEAEIAALDSDQASPTKEGKARKPATVQRPRPPLSTMQILSWADRHHQRRGCWPNVKSGRILGVPGDNWKSVDNALRYGLRGLPGGSSLALFLAQHRSVRNKASLPRLTIPLILSWADAHHQRTGTWPTMNSGPVVDAPGETWLGLDAAIKGGHRHLRGGDSLAQLLVRRRGARNHTNIPRLTVRKILAWADAHYERSGQWPNPCSGTIVDAPGETWAGVASALKGGYRGLPGGTTLYRLLREHRQIPGHQPAVRPIKMQAAGRGRRCLRLNFSAELLSAYRSGELDTTGVAARCRVSLNVAIRELRRAGETIRPRGRPRGQTRPAQHADIVRRYRGGQSIPQIAVALGLTPQRVGTVLKRYGVARRPAGPDLFVHGMTAEDRARLAARLIELRGAAGLTQDQLAANSGVNQVTISALENGRQCPIRRTVVALARALGVKPKVLVRG